MWILIFGVVLITKISSIINEPALVGRSSINRFTAAHQTWPQYWIVIVQRAHEHACRIIPASKCYWSANLPRRIFWNMPNRRHIKTIKTRAFAFPSLRQSTPIIWIYDVRKHNSDVASICYLYVHMYVYLYHSADCWRSCDKRQAPPQTAGCRSGSVDRSQQTRAVTTARPSQNSANAGRARRAEASQHVIGAIYNIYYSEWDFGVCEHAGKSCRLWKHIRIFIECFRLPLIV